MFELYLQHLEWKFSYQGTKGIKDLVVDKPLIDGFMSGTKAGIKALGAFLSDYAGAMIKVQVNGLSKKAVSNKELALCNVEMLSYLEQMHSEMEWRGNIKPTDTKPLRKIGIRGMFTVSREESKTVTGHPFSRFMNGKVQS